MAEKTSFVPLPAVSFQLQELGATLETAYAGADAGFLARALTAAAAVAVPKGQTNSTGVMTITGTPALAEVGKGSTHGPTILGGTPPYSLTLLSGTLPPGRTLAGLSITGTYTTAGSYTYTLRATDSSATPKTADLPLTVQVYPALGLSNASFAANAAAGSVIGNVTGLGTGETLTGVTPSDTLARNTTSLLVGLTASTSGTTIAAVLATSAGRTFSANITVSAAAVSLATLGMSGSLTQGVAASGVSITNATDGSTIALNIAGLTVSGTGATRAVSGTPQSSGALSATETLAGAIGSPRTTANVGTVAAPQPSTRRLSASKRCLPGLGNAGSLLANAVNTARIWDAPVAECRNVVASFWIGRVFSSAGFIDVAPNQAGVTYRYSILTGFTSRTDKNMSNATEWPFKFTGMASGDFAAAGGTVSADGYSITMPPYLVPTAFSWSGGLGTFTVPSSAGYNVNDVVTVNSGAPAAFSGQVALVKSKTATTLVVAMATDPGAMTTAPNIAKAWLVDSDVSPAGLVLSPTTGFMHKSYRVSTVGVADVRNIPAIRQDLGDLIGGPWGSNDWSATTFQQNSCLIPSFLSADGPISTRLAMVDGDSIASQNGGLNGSSIDTGDADGVLCQIKRALNAKGISWFDASVPGTNAAQYTTDTTTGPINKLSWRYARMAPLADFVVSDMLHNDRRSSLAAFDAVGNLKDRYNQHNDVLRGFMKVGAKLYRTTLMPQTWGQRITALSQSGGTATATVADTTKLTNGASYTIEGSSSSDYNITATITIISATQFTYPVISSAAASATVSINTRVGDSWKTLANQYGVSDDSQWVSDYQTNATVGHQYKLRDLIMRQNLYSGLAYGGAGEIDGGIDAYAAVGTSDGKWQVDGTPNKYNQDRTHPLEAGHAAAAAVVQARLTVLLGS